MRIMFASHAPWRGTGYGTSSLLTMRALRDLGHEIVWYSAEGGGPGALEYDGFHVILSALRDPYGWRAMTELCRYHKTDIIISHFDSWVLPPVGYQAGLPWYAWFPVDMAKLPYHQAEQIQHMARAAVYSQYGVSVVPEAVQIAPPIDLSVFTIAENFEQEKLYARRSMGMPEGGRVVGFVGSNVSGDRKALEAQVRGFAQYAKGRSDTRLLLYTEPNGTVNLPELVKELGIDGLTMFVSAFARNYIFHDHAVMVDVYRSLDVLLHASAAEGFGLCLAEAMACGTPVIYAENTSMPEVTDGVGYAVRDMIERENPHGGVWHYPEPEAVSVAIAAALDGDHEMYYLPQEYAAAAQRYTPEAAAMRWNEVIE